MVVTPHTDWFSEPPTATELLPCDWLISNLCYQVIEQVYLIKWLGECVCVCVHACVRVCVCDICNLFVCLFVSHHREIKSKIEKEETKRELLGSQSNLMDSHCIHCLQPFKFLVNSKRQCLDCKLYTCKTCSRYNKKERGWVCDPCRMSRLEKVPTSDNI